MAKQRLATLQHQKHTIQELEEENTVTEFDWKDFDVVARGEKTLLPTLQSRGSTECDSAVEAASGNRSCNVTSLDTSQSSCAAISGQPDTNAPLSKSASTSMDKDLLLDTSNSGFCNGGIQMNILASSDDTIDARTEPHHAVPVTSASSLSAASGSTPTPALITVSSGGSKSPLLITNNAVANKALYNGSHHPPLVTGYPAALRNRQKFANHRSVSTDVPSRIRQHSVEANVLSRPGSYSGALQRINSFDRGTQTVGKNTFVRLNAEHKRQPRYESAISDIGVEYMKATGAIGIRFKQLQKPQSVSHESVSASARLLSYEHDDPKDRGSTTAGSVDTQATPAAPMSRGQAKGSHVVKLNSMEQEESLHFAQHNHHHHIGYRLGRRKLLAERRRRVADWSCFFAMVGLVLMIVETECNIANVYSKVSN